MKVYKRLIESACEHGLLRPVVAALALKESDDGTGKLTLDCAIDHVAHRFNWSRMEARIEIRDAVMCDFIYFDGTIIYLRRQHAMYDEIMKSVIYEDVATTPCGTEMVECDLDLLAKGVVSV